MSNFFFYHPEPEGIQLQHFSVTSLADTVTLSRTVIRYKGLYKDLFQNILLPKPIINIVSSSVNTGILTKTNKPF